MKIWKKLLQVDRVHFILVTQVVTYIRTTPTPLLLFFIPYKFLVRMMRKFRITKEKEEDTIKRLNKTFKFFSFGKSLCEKILMLHISEFRVEKYADKGGFPLSLKFYIVYALVFDLPYVRK